MKDSYTIFGRGFIGSNISKFLKENKYNVFQPKRGKYKFNKDLNNIIYCIGSNNWVKDPKGSYDANLGIIPRIIFNNKFKSFTLISSTRIYLGNPSEKTKETDLVNIDPNKINFFFNSLKITAESLCLSLPNKKIRVVRLSNLFGDNFTNQIYLLPTLIRSSIKNKKINIFVSKKSTKDYLYINEAFNVLIKIINKGKYRIYNVASGKNIKLEKIIDKLRRITGCKVNYTNQKTVVYEPKININRIKNEFKFKSNKNLTNYLKQLILNYKKIKIK